METTEETVVFPATTASLASWPALVPGERSLSRRQPEEERARPVLRTLETLGRRDPDLRMHCEAVGDVAAKIALRLGFADREIGRIRLAGILHDIGKISLPATLLQKPGPLEPEEWDRVRQHPQIGFALLRSHGLDEIGEWVLAHHERPDGRGYPFGLQSRQIPLQGAVLAAADAFHAMVAERPYQASLSVLEAREELRRCSGTQFEPAVVAALCAVTKIRRFHVADP